MRKLIVFILVICSALALAGCDTEAYDKRAKSAKVKTIKREDCKPLYNLESIDETIDPTKACQFTDPRGYDCVQYTAYEAVVGVECNPPSGGGSTDDDYSSFDER